MSDLKKGHWDKVYGTKSPTEVSWYEERPARSLALIQGTGVQPADPIIDVGGGASSLVDELLTAGFQDLTVLDISSEVLSKLAQRLGTCAQVTLLQQDVSEFHPARRYKVWHDRAVFHFLTDPDDRVRYVSALRQALQPDGHLIIATFGPQGPERCSGLPIARYDAGALSIQLGKEFELMNSSLDVHMTPWGAEQQFLYCHFRMAMNAR